jgi:hypothetical protein
MNIDQMQRAIHNRCTQQFLYFESHKKIIKTATCMYTLLFVSVYFLSVQHLQYQHILLTRVLRRNFKKWTISGTCTNNGSKIKLSTNRGCITFAWIWGLTGITFARRKGITIARNIYGITFRRVFFFKHLRGLSVI